jgi:hypothetical protein
LKLIIPHITCSSHHLNLETHYSSHQNKRQRPSTESEDGEDENVVDSPLDEDVERPGVASRSSGVLESSPSILPEVGLTVPSAAGFEILKINKHHIKLYDH